MTPEPPNWTVEGEGDSRRVYLTGHWQLFTRTRDKDRLARELKQFERPQALAWDMRGIDSLDSAGAYFLWQLWGRQEPKELQCREEYSHWFERFAALPEQPPQPRRTIMHFMETFGGGVASVTMSTLGLFVLGGTVMVDFGHCVLRPRLMPWREISASVYRTGFSSLAILGVTGFIIGVVMALQFGASLTQFGASDQIIGLLGLAVLRELGPWITALIQAGRAGSAITAGIAGMHLTEELDALRTFGSSPVMRLVMPKVVAMGLVMPLLVIWTDFMELLGGAVAVQVDLGIPHQVILNRFPEEVSLLNFWFGLGKGVLFGVTIAIVSSFFGLRAAANTQSLGLQNTHSVVVGITLILILDAASGALLAKMGFLG